jgi:hypothetical protein
LSEHLRLDPGTLASLLVPRVGRGAPPSNPGAGSVNPMWLDIKRDLSGRFLTRPVDPSGVVVCRAGLTR